MKEQPCGVLTAGRKVLLGEAGCTNPRWPSSPCFQERLRFLTDGICRDPELPERSNEEKERHLKSFD